MFRLIAAALLAGAAFAVPASASAKYLPSQGPASRVDVAFVLDTTGSMADLIDGAKKKIWSIADEIRKSRPDAHIRFALIGYRDRGDDYVTDVTDLTDDLQTVYAKLLRFEANGGGDVPESVNEALHTGVTRLDWNREAGTKRIMFLVGDAPPHMDYKQDVPYTASMLLANEKGIIVNAVQAGDLPETEPFWRAIAALGKGEYMAIPLSGNVQVIHTPYDQQIMELQLKLNLTVVPYGNRLEQSRVEGKLRLKESASASANADMAGVENRASAPAARKVVTDDNDLVDRVRRGDLEIAAVPREELPEPMQAMEPADREAYIKTKIDERDALQAEVLDLIAQRDEYLAALPKTDGDASLDGELRRTLAGQLR
jgi:hypothetical protein